MPSGTLRMKPPGELRKRVTELLRDGSRNEKELETVRRRRKAHARYLRVAPEVGQALEELSQTLFSQVVGIIEEKLTVALQEVLEQPIQLRADPSFKRGSANVDFYVERDGQHEDIMRGQGGSVANVLSVGLRMFALTTLDERQHRRVLVLDEQDCWLRPDLVPRLVKIVHDAGNALGFQVLMISHHDTSAFLQYADKVYEFIPDEAGVRVELRDDSPSAVDGQH